MATTTNFGWETPDDTDLVKDGAAAMRTLGSAIDTSFVDLKGGTTGQVLSKASNTDLDYTWTTPEIGDITAVNAGTGLTGGGTTGSVTLSLNSSSVIAPTIVDAKGDLIAATANDTPARLAVGNNGEILVADSSTATGLRYQGNFAAGKNKIINGDFGIWQRGTGSFTADGAYTADRFQIISGGTSGTTTVTQQALAVNAISGYESPYYLQAVTAAGANTNTYSFIRPFVEDVRTLAGQTVTLSFWAKSGVAGKKIAVEINQSFGTGGSAGVNTYIAQTSALTTSFARYSVTFTMPSITGKTIGAGSYYCVALWMSGGSSFDARTGSLGLQNDTFSFWGVQLEAGSVATSFQTATGTIQGELAACQRYYWRNQSTSGFVVGDYYTSTRFFGYYKFPTTMRINPSFAASGTTIATVYSNGSGRASTNVIVGDISQDFGGVEFVTAAATAGNGGHVVCSTAGSYLEWSAEL